MPAKSISENEALKLALKLTMTALFGICSFFLHQHWQNTGKIQDALQEYGKKQIEIISNLKHVGDQVKENKLAIKESIDNQLRYKYYAPRRGIHSG